MSTIYKFQDSEPVAVATTTSTSGSGITLSSSDPVLIYGTNTARTAQTNVGSVSALQAVQNISSSTAAGFVNVSAYGLSIITAGATGGVAIMPAPPSAGLTKVIMMGATSTTTGFQVISGSSAVAIFSTGTSTNTIVPRLQTLFGQNSAYVELISLSTSAWAVTAKSSGDGAIVFTTTTAT